MLKKGIQTVTNFHVLKLKPRDSKYRLTDVVDIKGMFKIIKSIHIKNTEPIKEWLAKLGSKIIDEIFDPSITAERTIDIFKKNYNSTHYLILSSKYRNCHLIYTLKILF